jgi:ABC-2 type transport system ATP-binding protein
MSQRLSIARVLLHDPQVLLMDEPAAGLDPRARIEIRELLKELSRIGKTILISSHILSELAELCDSVGILEHGKLKFSGSMQEALHRAESGLEYEVIVEQRSKEAGTLLAALPGIAKVKLDRDGGSEILRLMLDQNNPIEPSEIPARLVTAGFRLREFRRSRVDLEMAFMHLTKGIVG